MNLRVVCACGSARAWDAPTFAEIKDAAQADGWDIYIPHCPEHRVQIETES